MTQTLMPCAWLARLLIGLLLLVGRAAAAEPTTCDAAAAYERLAPSVVRIEVGAAVATGFVYGGPRRIATAFHVVDAGSDLVVVLRDGRQFAARVTAVDEERDLAIIDLPPEAPALTPIPGRADATVPGLAVLAIGHPLATVVRLAVFPGNLGWSLSRGVVSTVGERWVQTDAALNPGNSGGPVVDCEGRLVGVASRILPAAGAGLGFLAPSEALEGLAQEPPMTKDVKRGWHLAGELGLRFGWGDGDGHFRYATGIAARLMLVRAQVWAVWVGFGMDFPWDAYALPAGVVSLERRQTHVALGIGPRFLLGTHPFTATVGLEVGAELSLVVDHGTRLRAPDKDGLHSADVFEDRLSKLIPTLGVRFGLDDLLPWDLQLGYSIGYDPDRDALVHRLIAAVPF